jgi:hypothetical protein
MVEKSGIHHSKLNGGEEDNVISPWLGMAGSIIGSRLFSNYSTQKVHVVHAMPGRIRIQCDQWKSKEVAQSIKSAFSGHSLVSQTNVSPVTGSLLLEFNVPHLTKEQLDQIIQHAVNASVSAYPRKKSDLLKSLKGVVKKVDGTIKTKTFGKADLNSILILFLFGKGLSVLKRNPSFAVGLLLWAYGLLTREEDNDD